VSTWRWLTSMKAIPATRPPRTASAAHGIRLEVVKLPEAKHGFILLPKRWIVERDFAWAARFRRLARDYERLSATLVGLYFVVFACLTLQHWIHLNSS
jgi:transposase